MLGIPPLNILISLPILSYFFVPATILSPSSWTTTLNLLFFYLLWSTLVLSYPPLLIELSTTLLVRVLFYIVPCALFLAFDLAIPKYSAKTKKHRRQGLTFQALGSSKKDAHQQRLALAKYLGVIALNTILGPLVQTALDWSLTGPLYLRSSLRISTTLPFPLAMIKELFIAYTSRNTLFYLIHRNLLHNNRRSPWLTAAHEKVHHSLHCALPFAATYDHPLAYLLLRWIPVYIPCAILRTHILTFLVLQAIIGIEEAVALSGYAGLPFADVLLRGVARRQEEHLREGGDGNFGNWGLLDWALGTSLPGEDDIVDDARQEARDRNVKGKAQNAARQVAEKADGAAQAATRSTTSSRSASNGRRGRNSRSRS